jgi:hypothetical protein
MNAQIIGSDVMVDTGNSVKFVSIITERELAEMAKDQIIWFDPSNNWQMMAGNKNNPADVAAHKAAWEAWYK